MFEQRKKIEEIDKILQEHTMKLYKIEEFIKGIDENALYDILSDYVEQRKAIIKEVMKLARTNDVYTTKINQALCFVYSTVIMKDRKLLARFEFYAGNSFQPHHTLYYKGKKYTGKDIQDLHNTIREFAEPRTTLPETTDGKIQK